MGERDGIDYRGRIRLFKMSSFQVRAYGFILGSHVKITAPSTNHRIL